jgi:23S rRNA (uracil1939-C5)-methyltransferase
MKSAAGRCPVTVGQEVNVTIDNYGSEGEGVARVEGFAVFVPGAIAGEEVRVRIDDVKANYSRGSIVDVLHRSNERADVGCDLYGECGGCQLMHVGYGAQLEMKRRRVAEALKRIGGIDGVTVEPTLGMDRPWEYRNKVQYPVGKAPGGRIVAGCFRRGTHDVVSTERCLIQHPLNTAIMNAVIEAAQRYGLSVYNETTGRGFLRYVLVKRAHGTGSAMVVLVTADDRFPKGKEFAADLARAVPEIASVVQSVNTSRGNRVLGQREKVLWGSPFIVDELDGLRFRISASSFYQVNPEQTVVLYREAVAAAGLRGSETVLDAYCGVGTLALFMARAAREVYGIEVVDDAITDARTNAELNAITNAKFIAGRVEAVLPELVADGAAFDVAVLDPPRAGCEAAVLRALAESRVGRIVYVSCNPATMARDAGILAGLGFRVERVQPVDMFPHTFHVETVVLITKKND